jgi:hypothetical protein
MVSQRISFDACFSVRGSPPTRANGDRSIGSSDSGGFGAIAELSQATLPRKPERQTKLVESLYQFVDQHHWGNR